MISSKAGKCADTIKLTCEALTKEIFHQRHPLQELVVDTFVPNDVYFVGGAGIDVILDDDTTGTESEDEQRRVKNSVIVCTGANACGKVVFRAFYITALLNYVETECLFEASALASTMSISLVLTTLASDRIDTIHGPSVLLIIS